MRCFKKGGDSDELLHNNVRSYSDIDALMRSSGTDSIYSQEYKKIIASLCKL